MALSFSSVTISPNPSNTGGFLNISTQVVDGNASKWLMDSSDTYLRGSGDDYLLTTDTSGTAKINYTATQVNNILAAIDSYLEPTWSNYCSKTSSYPYQAKTAASSDYLAKANYAAASDVNNYKSYTAVYNDYLIYYYKMIGLLGATVSSSSYEQNVLGLPLNTVYITTKYSDNPNNRFQGTWERITASNPFGTSGSSGSNSITLVTDNTRLGSLSFTQSHLATHTHTVSGTQTYIVGTTGSGATFVYDGGKATSGSYYYPTLTTAVSGVLSTTSGSAKTTTADDFTSVTLIHQHQVNIESGCTSASSTVNLQQAGNKYYTWRKTSMT